MKKKWIAAAVAACIQAASGQGSSPNAANDPYFSQQWALQNDGSSKQIVLIDFDNMHTIFQEGKAGQDIGWADAKSELFSTGTHPVTVAVIDSGLDAGHQDLVGRVAPGAKDFLLNFPIVTDPYGHGTHVSGIIAANADNGVGIAGITPPAVQILPLRVIWAPNDPRGNGLSYIDPIKTTDPKHPVYKLVSDFAADAVNYAVQQNVQVINLSMGWPKIVDTENVRTAIENAARKVLVVAAAGNDRKDQTTFPCSYKGVLCVGSITNTGQMAIYSNLGGRVDLLAPGDGILSIYPTQVESSILRINGYEILSGTSQAAPQVAGIAAGLLSINPKMSVNELKARLLVSGGALPQKDAALYGLVNLKRAIEAQPQPVYVPDFKDIDEIPVDEDTLQAGGQISVQNLWQDAKFVRVQILANGKPAGSNRTKLLSSGAEISVPWNYQFSSLDETSKIHLTVRVSDRSGSVREFSVDASAVRPMRAIRSNQTLVIPGVPGTIQDCAAAGENDLICSNNKHLFPNRLSTVESYPAEAGLPRYYKQLEYGPGGGLLEIYDPSSPTPVQKVNVYGIQGIQEVVRMDVKGTGEMDWVVIGIGSNPGESQWHYEWYFLDPSFQPLFGSQQASEFQIKPVSLNQRTGEITISGLKINRGFARPGSWIRSGQTVLPAFLASGSLPDPDNFGELDARRYASATQHLYYLSPVKPDPNSPNSKDQPQYVQLELRALDSATFRMKNPGAQLQNIAPEGAADQKAGRVRVLLAMSRSLGANMQILDVKSPTDFQLTSATGWNPLNSVGSPYTTLTPDSANNGSAFVNLVDSSRESIAWASADGQFLDRTEFEFRSAENPIADLIGAFNLPNSGRTWFVESGFDLLGYHQAASTGDAGIVIKTTPIERDSSFDYAQFSQMFTPVLVGTASNPLPGVYIDSTLVRGDQVSVAVWDPVSDDIVKPLRYSLQIPEGCMEMNPVQLRSEATSFALPLLCSANGQLQLMVVKPQ